MATRIARLQVVLLLLLTPACGGGAPDSPSGVPLRHGEISDPIADSLPGDQVRIPPDLVQGTVDVFANNVTFTVRLASGTFAATTVLNIRLDTDQDASTGLFQGTDYIVNMGEGYGSRAVITKYVGTAALSAVGDVPASFAADGISVSVPRSLFGNDDGAMDFRVLAFTRPTTSSVFLHDAMPDASLPPGRVQ